MTTRESSTEVSSVLIALLCGALTGCAPMYWTEAQRAETKGIPAPEWIRGNYQPPEKEWHKNLKDAPEETLAEYESATAEIGSSGEDLERAAARLVAGATGTGASRTRDAGSSGNSLPSGFSPWWAPLVTRPINAGGDPVSTDVESLFLNAIAYSDQIKVFSDIPLIRETGILEAEGKFDPRVYVEGEFRNINEPVGSTLKTGGPARFKEDEWALAGGVRKLFSSGAEVDFSQRIGGLDNNSVYLVPDDQALTGLDLSVSQPLLRGGGFEYNRATIRIAQLDHQAGLDEFQRQAESHLLDVARAYWALYRTRGELLIKTKLVEETAGLAAEIAGRRVVDATESQILRAEAALAARRSETVRAGLSVRNAEAKVVSLVNAPLLQIREGTELVPSYRAVLRPRNMSVREAAQHSLRNRPEVKQAMKVIKAGLLRLQMSENELLPELDLLVGMTWRGLEGNYDVDRALGNQFNKGSPSLEGGLRLVVPLGNNEAKARYQRRRIEMRQLTNQLRTTLDTLLLEVQVAVREVNISYREVVAKQRSVGAAEADLSAKRERMALVADAGATGGTRLDELLDAQLRLALADIELLDSVVNYNIALANLDRAMGVLLQARHIDVQRQKDEYNLPSLELRQASQHNAGP